MSVVMPAPRYRSRPNKPQLPKPWRWTRADYHRARELGFFSEDDMVELIDGEIYTASPQSRKHFNAIQRGARVLARVFGTNYSVEQQGPAGIASGSEPEPDVMVIRGESEDYEEHPEPADIVLLVEVSDSSLAKDRVLKGSSYARAGIADYWLLNLKNRTLEVRRDSGPMPNDPLTIGYRSVKVLTEQDAVSPLAVPAASIRVTGLLNRATL